MAASLHIPMHYFDCYVLFLTLVPQVILGFITYSREELLDIRATSTHHHYDQYNIPEADPVFCPPPGTMDRIPAGEPIQRRRKRGRQSGLLVRLRRRAHRAPLPSILLANVQSLANKVDEIRARAAFQRVLGKSQNLLVTYVRCFICIICVEDNADQKGIFV